jgi:uncharacterized RmlC-like cupin family protein
VSEHDSQRPNRLHHVPTHLLTSDTAQSAGMRRLEAISKSTTGSSRIWMGESHLDPATRSSDHHHGDSETGIYILQGHPVFVLLEDGVETRIETKPGDYVFVPPFAAHREENPSTTETAIVILARSTQEAIVVNLTNDA